MKNQVTCQRNMFSDLEPVLVGVEKNDPLTRDISISKNEFKIGRGSRNDEIIPDLMISRHHCILKWNNNNDWQIKNLSSRVTLINHILLGYEEVRTVYVGDIVQLGSCGRFRYIFTFVVKDKSEAEKLQVHENNGSANLKMCIELEKLENKALMDTFQIECNSKIDTEREFEKRQKNDRQVASRKSDDLVNQVIALKQTKDMTDISKLQLHKMILELHEMLEKKNLEFQIKIRDEKRAMKEALRMCEQQKELLEITTKETMEKYKIEQQVELRRLEENMQKEKKMFQSRLSSEMTLLQEKLKNTEKALEESEANAKELQTIVIKQNGNNLPKKQNVCTLGPDKYASHRRELTDSIHDNPECVKVSKSNAESSYKKNIIKTIRNVMDQDLTCTVCSELFITAVTLNCMHSFCQYCIKVWSKNHNVCPVCRSRIFNINRSLTLDNVIDNILNNLSVEYKTKREEVIKGRKMIMSIV